MSYGLRAWDEQAPPPQHWVMASYSVMDELQLLKTCRRGCCVYSVFGSMRLPRYWRDATADEVQRLNWQVPQPKARQDEKETSAG